MIIRRILLLFILIFSFSKESFSINEVELIDYNDFLVGGNSVEILEDSTATLSIQEVLAKGNNFKIGEGYSITTKNRNSNYWIRFKIKKPIQDERKWLLEILDSRQDLVEVYEPKEDGTYKVNREGFFKDFYSRNYTHKNFIFEINPLKSNNQYYYVKFRADVSTSLLFKIRTTKDFTLYAINEYYLLGLYYGILMMMAIYSLFVFVTTREKVYLLYLLYILSWMFHSLITDNIGIQYFWPSNPIVSQFGFYFARMVWLSAFIFYSLEFLNVTKVNKFRGYIIWSLVIFLFYNALNLISSESFNTPILYHLVFLLPFFLIYYVSIVNLRQGFKPARYFLAGNSIVLLGVIVNILRDNGLMENYITSIVVSIIAVYSINIAIILEIMVFSFAMADRIRFFKNEKEKTQHQLIEQLNENQALSQKVNRELEAKVKERTVQLEEQTMLIEDANKKLLEQAEKINQMNAILDLDNWNLKKKIIEEKQSRITFKDISFEEFMHVYPNEVSCYSFLEEMKWAEGFACIKCGNTKFGKGINKFSRRCTKCRYDETVTTNTIFYKCKFPINKALYIVVMVNRYGEEISFTDLSNKLELRNATCWSFARKVLEVRGKSKYQSLSDDHKLKYLVLNK